MLTPEQKELKAMMDAADEVNVANAIRAGCTASDLHLACSYPGCACKTTPTIVRAAISSYMLRLTVEE